MDYTHAIEQDADGGHALSFSDEFLAPKPDLSGTSSLANAITILRCSVLSTNPVEIIATADSDPFTRVPLLAFRNQVMDVALVTTETPTIDIAALAAPPGALLLAHAFAQAGQADNPIGGHCEVLPGPMAGWEPIVSYVTPEVGGSAFIRGAAIVAFWKIADGTENSIDPVAYDYHGGTDQRVSPIVWQVMAFDVLGGAVTVAPLPSASAKQQNSNNSQAQQTIQLDGRDPPALAVSFSARTDSAAAGVPAITLPDQAFSETPDGNFTASNTGYTDVKGRGRLKFRLFDATPADVTTSQADEGNTTFSGLLSYGIYLD
jgi:hypothetical protein